MNKLTKQSRAFIEEEQRVVHYDQHYQGNFKCVRVIVIGPGGNPESYQLHNSKNLNSRLVPVDLSLATFFLCVVWLN